MLSKTSTGPVESQWNRDDSLRTESLERAREAAFYSDPAILPDDNRDGGDDLDQSYQSVGALGAHHVTGRLLTALFPVSQPWFETKLAPEILYSQEVRPEALQASMQTLFVNDMATQAALESTALNSTYRRQRLGFRSQMLRHILQIVATGDSLAFQDDELRLHVYRRDKYVTKRDGAGDVLYHITKVTVDPLTLSDAKFAASKLSRRDLEGKSYNDRKMPLYTIVEWQQQSRTWSIKQEINGEIVFEKDEPVSPYFATPYRMVGEEDYGRGLIELNIGDLRSLDGMSAGRIDIIALAAKSLIALAEGSNVDNEQLEKARSGGIIEGAMVRDGKCQDIAPIEFTSIKDLSIVSQGITESRQGLGRQLMLESASQPTGDRVTATAIRRIALELEGQLGGLYIPIADSLQQPLLARTVHVLRKESVLNEDVPFDAQTLVTLTGLNALQKEVQAGKLLDWVTLVQQLGENAFDRIDEGVLMDVFARYNGIYEPGLVLSDEKVQEKQEARARMNVAEQGAIEGAKASMGQQQQGG